MGKEEVIRAIDKQFIDLLTSLKDGMPREPGDEGRRWAITFTETEKAYAYYLSCIAGPFLNALKENKEEDVVVSLSSEINKDE